MFTLNLYLHTCIDIGR